MSRLEWLGPAALLLLIACLIALAAICVLALVVSFPWLMIPLAVGVLLAAAAD